MSIFEKIKQFIKNIGNKQKLLESPKEIREEMSNMVSSNKKESKFLEDIKFDPKDLLDPKVCNGKDLVPNILRTLGANEDVVKNPQLIEEIRVQFQRIANQSGIEMPNYYEQPTRETINAIVEAIKTNGILTSQDRYNKYARLSLKGHEVYEKTNDIKQYCHYRNLYNNLSQQIVLSLILMEKCSIIKNKIVVMDEIEFPVIDYNISNLQNNLKFLAAVHPENAFGTFYVIFDKIKFKIYQKRKD